MPRASEYIFRQQLADKLGSEPLKYLEQQVLKEKQLSMRLRMIALLRPCMRPDRVAQSSWASVCGDGGETFTKEQRTMTQAKMDLVVVNHVRDSHINI